MFYGWYVAASVFLTTRAQTTSGIAMGIVVPVGSIGQTCFPFVLGLMRDRFANDHSGLILVSGLALAIALLPEKPAQARSSQKFAWSMSDTR